MECEAELVGRNDPAAQLTLQGEQVAVAGDEVVGPALGREFEEWQVERVAAAWHGRRRRRDLHGGAVGQVVAEQFLALLVVILVFILKVIAIVLVIGFALVALAYLFLDLRRH